ncbi:MAG: hypothetical protein WAM04_05185 [Candidatus Sulfotelmatobacter sp.]
MSSASPWIALVAAVGAGTIIAAVLTRWSVISNHRQNWINALRDDIATYLKEIDAMHYRIGKVFGEGGEAGTTEDLEKQQDTRNAALLVYRRILLRLNVTEVDHIQLAEGLRALHIIKAKTADTGQVDAVIALARKVLKHEWAVTKYGMFANLVIQAKSSWREMNGPQ